jgi:pimeloyl-ACP methyl ester carboxylesterase
VPVFDLDGARVEYSDRGHGEPVIALHCSGSSGAQWCRLADALGERFRVLAPDLHGHGGSTAWPGRRPIAFADEARIVARLLEACGGAAHLVGHSFGGAVALHAARLHAPRVRSLALIEPVAFHLLRDGDGEDAAALREIVAVAEGVTRALVSGDHMAGFGRFVDYWNGPGAWTAVPAAKRAALATSLGAIALNFSAGLGEPTRPVDFRALRAQTLVLRGERSTRAGRQVSARVAGALPNARLVTLSGAGHMAPLTHADEVLALLRAHLEAHAASPGAHPERARPGRLTSTIPAVTSNAATTNAGVSRSSRKITPAATPKSGVMKVSTESRAA